MNSVRVKICGITRLDDAIACAEAGADYIGFVFHRASPRYIPPARAGEIIGALPPGVTPVGVFVNESLPSLRAAVVESGIRLVQLSGDESPEDCRLSPLPVIKVFRAGPASVRNPGPADYPVFARMADGGFPGEYGGTGREAAPSLVRSLAAEGLLFLAGGLGPGNVAARINGVRPFAVDVSSGVEVRPGVKRRDRVRSFCSIVKSINL
jgi:phosphoribosylanthranilate isomerase